MDVDNDTDLDLFVAEHDFLSPYGENYLYENHGPASSFAFEPFGTEVYDTDYLNSHVVASADFDRNGWIDFVMHNIGNHVVRIWMNSGFDDGHESIGIALEGTLSNRPAIGSQIDLVPRVRSSRGLCMPARTTSAKRTRLSCLGWETKRHKKSWCPGRPGSKSVFSRPRMA